MVSMDAVIKVLGSHYPILQLLFFNALFSLLPLTYFILKNPVLLVYSITLECTKYIYVHKS